MVQCREKLWGRYVNIQSVVSFLEICEVEIFHKLDVGILYQESTVTTVFVNEGDSLEPLLCGVSPDPTGYNSALQLNWKRDNGTSLSNQANRIAQLSQGQQKLYVRNASAADEGWYTCEYTRPGTRQTNTTSVQILVNVDCEWTEWSSCSASCGLGKRTRSPTNPAQRYRGRRCVGPSVKSCNDPPLCAPSITNYGTVRQLDEGDRLVLACEATIPRLLNTSETVNFEWRKYGQNGKEISIRASERINITSARNRQSGLFYGTIIFKPVLRVDSGAYTCRINNSIGTSNYSTNNVTVNVKFGPEQTEIHLRDAVTVKGSSVILNCTASGNPRPTYCWLKDGKRLDGSEQTLSLSTVSYDDAGVYICVASNTIEASIKTDNASTVMSVEGFPQNCSILMAESYNSSSITLSVACFNGNSPITEYRLRFKKRADTWTQRTVKTNSTMATSVELVLSDLEAYTQYDVQVIAGNRHGYDSGRDAYSKVVTVRTAEGAPSKPQRTQFSFIPPKSLRVTWEEPVEANGVITHYNVRYRRLGENGSVTELLNISVSQLVVMIHNVTYGSSYLFEIQAVTVKPGPFANVTALVEPFTPSTPRDVSVMPVSATSVSVRWSEPISPNGIILYYTIWYGTTTSNRKTVRVSAASTSHNVTELSPYTTYNITVTATNNAKKGNQSEHGQAVSVRTLSSAPEAPSLPREDSLLIFSSTVTFISPAISAAHGPVKYVDIVVSLRQKDGSLTGEYTAARYSYGHYEDMIAGRRISLGTGHSTTDAEGMSYTDMTLQPATQYTIYMQVVPRSDGLALRSVRGLPFNFTTGNIPTPTEATSSSPSVTSSSSEDTSSSDQQPPIAIIAGIIGALIVFAVVLTVIVIVRRRTRTRKETIKEHRVRQQISLTSVSYAALNEPNPLVESSTVADGTELLNITAYEGTTTLLPCDVIGDPRPTIMWSKDRKQLPGGDPRILVLGDGALQVENVRTSDAGTYICSAGNEMGAEEQTVKLTVKKQQQDFKKRNPWENPDTPVVAKRLPMRHVNSGLHAIPIDDFPEYVTAMHEHGNAGFSDEFQSLAKVGKDLAATSSLANKAANRYKNIVTYDHSRVVLPVLPGLPECQSDYIAAAYVDGYRKPQKYIAAQGPMEHTCVDFWRMIWSEDISSIVMLTGLVEATKAKCHPYWPDSDGATAWYSAFAVTLTETDTYADYTVRSLTVALGDQMRTVNQYHFTAWPDHDVPKYAIALLGFIAKVNRHHPQDKGPMAVHCSAGVGRTGTFIVIDTMLDRAEDGQPIDIYSCVNSLRTRRAQMVQTQTQYMFIHDAVMEAVICGNTEIPVHNLRNAVTKLSKKDSKSGLTGFELHFKVLQALGPHSDQHSCKSGLQPAVQKKNRYEGIVPFDRYRVILQVLEDLADGEYVNTAIGTDYINASYVDGYRRRDAFIVTQSPLANTVNDFWKMVWEQDSYSIVMLTSPEEEEKEMGHQYWPETSGSAQYGQLRVDVKDETQRENYMLRRMMVTEGEKGKLITQFHYTDWPDKGSPQTPSVILNMADQLQKWQQATGDKVITVHCNNGVGRSGAFCGLLSLIELVKMEGVVDFFHKVKSMRIQRPGMVQTVDQYVFMHQAVLAYLDKFDVYDNFN